MLTKLLHEQKVDVFTAKIIKKTKPAPRYYLNCSFNHPIIIEMGTDIIGIIFWEINEPTNPKHRYGGSPDIHYGFVASHIIENENRIIEEYEVKELNQEMETTFNNNIFSLYSPIDSSSEHYLDNLYIEGYVPNAKELTKQTLRIYLERKTPLSEENDCLTMKVNTH